VRPGAPDNGMWIPERGLGDTDGISVTGLPLALILPCIYPNGPSPCQEATVHAALELIAARLKVLCSYQVTALSKLALLRYLSEIRLQVLTAIYPRFTHKSGTIRKKQAIDGRN